MLRPKKKFTKKEIKKDPLLETIYKFQKFFDKKRRLLILVSTIGILLILVVVFLQSFITKRNFEANKIMTKAMSLYQMNKYEDAFLEFDILINDYKNTTDGNNALYYIAKIRMRENNIEEAKKYANDYIKIGKTSSYILGSRLLLAEISESEGNYADASINYLKASKISKDENTKNRILINLVSCYHLNGKLDEASKIIKDLEENISTTNPLYKDFVRIKSNHHIQFYK
tara:strand:+ start:150 stop:836 length:687 start_codon:yes stop_codon:yes gene_type:complete